MTADTEGATGAQAAPETQPPAGDAKSQADNASESQSESMSLEEAKKLRSEASSLRRRLKELEDVAQKATEARLSDEEKLIAKARREGAAEVMASVNERIRRAAVRSELTAAGANLELLDLAMNDELFAGLEVDEAGEVQGIASAIAAIKKARPSLFMVVMRGAGSVDAGARGTTAVPDANALLRAAIRGR